MIDEMFAKPTPPPGPVEPEPLSSRAKTKPVINKYKDFPKKSRILGSNQAVCERRTGVSTVSGWYQEAVSYAHWMMTSLLLPLPDQTPFYIYIFWWKYAII